MSRDSQRYRKTYSYYRVQPKTEQLEVIVDENLDWKNSVRAASTGSHSLTGVGTSLSIGGVTIVNEDRVLLKDQGTASQNGIYYFEVTGGNYALTRASDARDGTLSCGAATYVEEGTNAGKIYILSTTNPITIDSTSLTWTELSGGGSTSPGGSDTYVQFNDGGSFGGDSDLRFNKTTGALTGTYVIASTGFSGSLTKLTDGTSYLRAGTNITISTGSNGAVTIEASGGSGPTGSGTDGYLAQWSGGTTVLGDSFVRNFNSDIAKYMKKEHWFEDSAGGSYVYIKSNSTDTGRLGINVNPSFALDIIAGANSINEAVRIRNNNAGQGTGLRQTFIAGNYSEPTFRITHAWPSNAEGHYTFFGITKPTPSAGTPSIAERLSLYSSGSVEVSGSFQARLDPEIINKPIMSVQKSNGSEVMWISSSAGAHPIGGDMFMWVSGSRTTDSTSTNRVVFGGDVRISGSLSVESAGYGIKLPSSPGSSGTQFLDCYYEQDLSVSPGDTSGTLDATFDTNSTTLKMTRVGRLVTISGRLEVDYVGTGGAGTTRLFIDLGISSGDRPSMPTAAAIYLDGFAADFDDPVMGYVDNGTSRLYIDRFVSGASASGTTSTYLAPYLLVGSEIIVSVTYAV